MTALVNGCLRPYKPDKSGIGDSGNEYNLTLDSVARDQARLSGISRQTSATLSLGGSL